MERLGCGPAEAQRQLAHLAAEAGTTVAELAAEVTGQRRISPRLPGAAAAEAAAGAPAGRRLSLAGAAIEVADDGAEIAAALMDQALAPAGAIAVALWLHEPDGGLQLAGQAGFGPRGEPVAAHTSGDELADPAGRPRRR